MSSLSENWVTEGRIDFEYKKYLLLAYLQSAAAQFSEHKIYPFLNELVLHHRNLTAIKSNAAKVEKHFAKDLTRIDLQNFALHYEKIINDEECMEEIQSIVNYALPRISDHIEIAREIYEEVAQHISISSIGLVPLQNSFGYMLFRNVTSETSVYQYELTIFESMYEKYCGLKTTFMKQYSGTLYNFGEAIKYDLIREHKEMPNPATYLLDCSKAFPFSETVFPVAKRRFVQFLSEERSGPSS